MGTAVINANLAGGDIAIIQSQMNTLPYFIIGNANIKSPEGLKGRAAAVHIPGTSADFAMRLALMKVGIPYKTSKRLRSAVPPPGSPRSPRARLISLWSPTAKKFRAKKWD